jgi:flagellar export protein FliJ
MKKFRFPLAPVGILRTHQELRAREEFAAAVHQFVQTEEKLARLRARSAELAELLSSGRTDKYLAAEAASLLRVYRDECQVVVTVEREVAAAQEKMQAKRQAYIEANRRLKIVQRLEEKARANHYLAVQRASQEELDELAGFRAFRQPTLS